MELQIKEIKKQYEKFKLDVSLNVMPGQITGLVGKNGAGKSTTFKAILGLIKTEGGEILLDGQSAATLTNKEKEKLGVVLSNSHFSGWLTINDIIPVLRSMYVEFEEAFFTAKCAEMELPMKKPIKEFSTGMAAKLKVLIAISHNAEFLILDEPTSGLDVMARNEILDMLREYMTQENRSILISSHISSDLEHLCDDLYMIDNGQIMMHEETDELLGRYGILKLTEQQYGKLDRDYLLKQKKDSNGYTCLTREKAFYVENYPDIVVENGTIDEVFTLMIQGEEI